MQTGEEEGTDSSASGPERMPRPVRADRLVGYAALGIAILALVLSVTAPGPTGPRGAQGPQGPAGPTGPAGAGTIIVSKMDSSLHPLNSTCWQVGAFNLTIQVPGPGTIVASSALRVMVHHTAGTYDFIEAGIELPSLGLPACSGFLAPVAISPTEPNETAFYNIPIVDAFPIQAAGAYTFTAVAAMPTWTPTGPDFAGVQQLSMILVFYPQ